MEELKLTIHETLCQWMRDYIPTQEITHAANEICKAINEDGTYDENVLLEMHSYLQRPDKEFVPLQTVNTKSLTNNQIILVMNDIREKIKAYAESNSSEPEQSETPVEPTE